MEAKVQGWGSRGSLRKPPEMPTLGLEGRMRLGEGECSRQRKQYTQRPCGRQRADISGTKLISEAVPESKNICEPLWIQGLLLLLGKQLKQRRTERQMRAVVWGDARNSPSRGAEEPRSESWDQLARKGEDTKGKGKEESDGNCA